MNIVKKFKVKLLDGSYSDYIYLGAEANDITMSDGSSVEDKLNEIVSNIEGDLTNYYTKEQTYTKEEVDKLIGTFVDILVVEELPEENISLTTIYLVPKDPAQEDNGYGEWVYSQGQWEKIGDTKTDLSNYYTIEETEEQISQQIANEGVKVYSGTDTPTAEIGKDGDLYILYE